MAYKITIGNGKERDNKETKPVLNETDKSQIAAAGAEQDAEQIPVDENVWGNDYTILDKLDEKQLADRRLFVRVRHVQKVECNTAYDSIEQEPVLLAKPITFIISDISVGGIGIVCENEISIGKVLGIPIVLDTIPYEIKCEVIYCVRSDDKYRAGLKIVQKDKKFMRHLKIFIARISLNSLYGESYDSSELNAKTPVLIKLKQRSS